MLSAIVGGAYFARRAVALPVTDFYPLPSAGGGTPVIRTTPGGGLTQKGVAAGLISKINLETFGGWFFEGGRSEKDVLAIFKIESNYEPTAINTKDAFGGAWGIGQVLADIARIDYGVSPAALLLDPRVGVLTSMRHMRFQWDDLTRRLGRAPTKKEWITAYNSGSRGVAEGRGNSVYYAKFLAARAVI